MNGLFFNCQALTTLPDISKWKIDNVNNIDLMFGECSSLISFPDISKWNFNNINKIDSIFKGCKESIIPSEFKEGCIIL